MTPYETFNKMCKGHNVSAYKVSKETGITQSTFSDWKYGRYMPKIDKLCTIANYFDVPVTVFIEGYEDGKVSS